MDGKATKAWKLEVKQARYSEWGNWYSKFTKFPAALVDKSGYLLVPTETALEQDGVRITKQINVPRGIASLPRYIRMLPDIPGEVVSSAGRREKYFHRHSHINADRIVRSNQAARDSSRIRIEKSTRQKFRQTLRRQRLCLRRTGRRHRLMRPLLYPRHHQRAVPRPRAVPLALADDSQERQPRHLHRIRRRQQSNRLPLQPATECRGMSSNVHGCFYPPPTDMQRSAARGPAKSCRVHLQQSACRLYSPGAC
jgi:hypothetical protein